jgi:acetyl esterase/lipase
MRTPILLLAVAAGSFTLGAEPDAALSARVAAALPTVDAVAKAVMGEVTYLEVTGRPAFLIQPQGERPSTPVPWVWYAPTIGGQPRPAHAWMFRQFLAKGISIAGIDVGESMGNPKGRAAYSAFHKLLTEKHGFAKRASLMPQSRGGLMLYNWAAEHPDHVACIAGIYTVCDMSVWPGLKRAGAAYEMSEKQLAAVLAEHNPIDRLAPLAKADVPILHIHGDSDKPVPIERNAGELARRYRKLGGKIELIVVPGKGHEEATEIFQRQQVVDFVINNARPPTERALFDLSYAAADSPSAYEKERLKLDLYLPAREAGFATIVWFHGGGLRGGAKSGATTVSIAERFARAGIAVAAVNYRLSPNVTFPAYVEDAARSFAWVRRHISEYGGHPRRVFVSGHSAGGYLAALLGLDPKYLRRHGLSTDTIAGVIPVSGQMVTHSTVRKERGIPAIQPVIDAAAPSYHVRAEAPCVLAICGADDLPARAAESLYFTEALKAAGHSDVRYLEVKGRDHSTIVSKIAEPGDVVAQAILQFVAEHSLEVESYETGGHRFLAADSSKERVAIVSRDGKIEWEFKIGPLHDLHRLASANILFQVNWTRLVEVDPKTNEVVWEYDAQEMNGNAGRHVEVHAFQRRR